MNTKTKEMIKQLEEIDRIEEEIEMLECKRFTSMGILFHIIEANLSEKIKNDIINIVLGEYIIKLNKLKEDI